MFLHFFEKGWPVIRCHNDLSVFRIGVFHRMLFFIIAFVFFLHFIGIWRNKKIPVEKQCPVFDALVGPLRIKNPEASISEEADGCFRIFDQVFSL
ncbi:hypothetical protein OOT00_09915 [Desulfobotulus sp. H1]|uniref:Uncharacterized protein n=1 Tax=Desulfobotulus pelophilus TaxID=2823377 RepID=A0ABT3NA10_9BACT|nr:hypothetical protein [Desulfobotulus pelophilus]MCW7754302.1 hypothetical protein [Desulfobotulus pelophilus]